MLKKPTTNVIKLCGEIYSTKGVMLILVTPGGDLHVTCEARQLETTGETLPKQGELKGGFHGPCSNGVISGISYNVCEISCLFLHISTF